MAVAHSKDIDEYGMDTFLSPFVDDLKTLYLDGITVTIDSKQSTYYGGLLVTLADNLGAHSLGGFKESYSFALRICRTCMITGEQAQSTFSEVTVSLGLVMSMRNSVSFYLVLLVAISQQHMELTGALFLKMYQATP